ncbi:hypothetical protein HPB51_007705 [Rhipicephalus microplus]|uniref:Uncharacterized protein n=1 Tax=Rhipicephalus microplus TaxID=6941 RepID=A0A9J6DTW2_RHIMP|nr:hypothetical protein HPB51_007705 [Rhipicephalus microplus]
MARGTAHQRVRDPRERQPPAPTATRQRDSLNSLVPPPRLIARGYRRRYRPNHDDDSEESKGNAQSCYKPRRRCSQRSESLTYHDEDEDCEGDLFQTPLPGFKTKTYNRRAVENRYRPLNIRVTRHSTTVPKETERPATPQHSDDEKEREKDQDDDPSSTSDKTSEASQSDASEEHSSDDSTGISDEVCNGDVVSISKHLMMKHEPSFHTTKDKQNSLICKNELTTAAVIKYNDSDVAAKATVAESGHAMLHQCHN